MLGLEPGTVSLARDHVVWQMEFGVAAAALRRELGVIAHVEHVGSTAVDGLLAKPIVDIAIGLVQPTSAPTAFDRLPALGYRYRGFRLDSGGHVWDFSHQGRHTRYVHLVVFGGDQWNRYLVLRDYLRGSATARAVYEAHKENMAVVYQNDRKRYTESKRGLIDQLLADAAQSKNSAMHVSTRRLLGLLSG